MAASGSRTRTSELPGHGGRCGCRVHRPSLRRVDELEPGAGRERDPLALVEVTIEAGSGWVCVEDEGWAEFGFAGNSRHAGIQACPRLPRSRTRPSPRLRAPTQPLRPPRSLPWPEASGSRSRPAPGSNSSTRRSDGLCARQAHLPPWPGAQSILVRDPDAATPRLHSAICAPCSW